MRKRETIHAGRGLSRASSHEGVPSRASIQAVPAVFGPNHNWQTLKRLHTVNAALHQPTSPPNGHLYSEPSTGAFHKPFSAPRRTGSVRFSESPPATSPFD